MYNVASVILCYVMLCKSTVKAMQCMHAGVFTCVKLGDWLNVLPSRARKDVHSERP